MVSSLQHNDLSLYDTGSDVNQPSIEYSLQNTSTGVCITCTFLDSSATDCVAVVHQRISQLNSSGLMNIESSHMFSRTNDTASGCIEGINAEDYQVGAFGWRKVVSPTSTPTGKCLRNYHYEIACHYEEEQF